MLRILARCAHRSAEQGPLWGCDRVGVHKNAVHLGALASHYRVASPQVGALQGGAGSIAVCAMDATPETRKGRPHAPRPASLSHPRKRGPCSELCRPLLRRPRAHLAVVRVLPGADFAGFPSAEGRCKSAPAAIYDCRSYPTN